MRITSLTLQHFRSYDSLTLPLSEKSRQFFSGDNGSGKTNLVEAISILSHGRSCLKADLQDIVRFGSTYFKIRAELLHDTGDVVSVECVFQTSPRRASAYFINDVRTPLLSFIGTLPTIIFLPQDLDLFTGSPSGRRNFLDTLLSQLRRDFAAVRLGYERVLKQRNALLKRIAQGEATESELDVWDDELAAAAGPIMECRREALKTMSDLLPAELQKLAEPRTSIMVVPAFTAAGDDPVQSMKEGLLKYRSRDVILQTTTVGPHRDDWRIEDEGKDIAVTASRGQQRTILLGLLFVNAGLFTSIRQERPVILLDDVLSELDQDHQDALLTHLQDHQVIITSTHGVPQTDDRVAFVVREGKVDAA